MKKLEKSNLGTITGGVNTCGNYGILYGVGLTLMLCPATAVVGVFCAGLGAVAFSRYNC